MRKTLINSKSSLFVLLILFITSIISFIIGTHWHGTLGYLTYLQKLKPNKLTCYGHNNFTETFQQDCYAPYDNKSFVWSNELTCRYVTFHSLDVDSITQRLSIVNAKRDYEEFQLKIDEEKKSLVRTSSPGAVVQGSHTIIHEDDNAITAQRQFALPFNEFNYEQIFLSKKSGIGTISYTDIASYKNNPSKMGTNFFYCE